MNEKPQDGVTRPPDKIVGRTLDVTPELIVEAKDILSLSYLKKGVEGVPDFMPKQRRLVGWAIKTAKIISGESV